MEKRTEYGVTSDEEESPKEEEEPHSSAAADSDDPLGDRYREAHLKRSKHKKKKKLNFKRPHILHRSKHIPHNSVSQMFYDDGGSGDEGGEGEDGFVLEATGLKHENSRHRRAMKLEMVEYKYPHRYEHRHEPKREDYTNLTPWKFVNAHIYTGAIRIHLLWSFLHLVTPHAAVVMALTLLCTWLCWYKDWNTDTPITIISAAIIFPVSFG